MDSDGSLDSAGGAEPRVALDVLPLHSTNLLTVLDENGIVQYESPAIERIYGFDQETLVGREVAEYFHPADRKRVLGAFRAVVDGGESTVESVEYRHEQADGTYLWVESVASGNPTPNGHYVVNTRDISEQKRRERQLEATNDRLEEFASIVGHDLRNPLNVAQGRAELARQEHESDHLERVSDAHDRMEALIDDLLTLSRVGRQVSETEPVALTSVAETCWRTVPTGEATLVTDTDRRLLADRARLRRLLENLFRNAVEHGSTSSRTRSDDAVEHGSTSPRSNARGDTAEHGESDVTVRVGDLDAGFFVEDDGPGIPPSARERIFEAGNSAKRDGTGLGLNIVEQIADAHGWQIRCTEGPAGGARFEITGIASP